MFAAKNNSEKILLEIGQYFQDKHQFKMNPAIRNTSVSENGNKIGVNEYGTKYEYAVPTYAPSVAELPTLNINNGSVSVTIKSKDNNISVDLNSKDATNLTLSTKDITKDINLENLKDKIVADNNNNINNKDQITSIRVVDLELQKNNEKVELNASRTVKIALLKNEQNKDIFVYHIKQDNSIEFIPSEVTKDSLQFTVDHFSKFAIVAKIKTPLSPSENDRNAGEAQEEQKLSTAKTTNTSSTTTSRTLPNTGESTNNFLSAIGLSFLALIGLLKRRNNN